MIPAREALARLREGNARFASNARGSDPFLDDSRRVELTKSQEPFAIILGCSDSRVPAEIVFDQGLGDLFVIRVAGNIVAPSQVGSVEFAADALRHAAGGGARPLPVRRDLGHGRGTATPQRDQSPQPRRDRGPGAAGGGGPARNRPRHDLDASGRRPSGQHPRVHDHLRHGSEVLEQLIQNDGLLIVGAEYSLETGVVEFFDGVKGAV